MIDLRFELRETLAWDTRDVLATLDEMGLRYSCLFGDLILTVDGNDLSARWGWIPLLDVASAFALALHELSASPDASSSIDFTECDDRIECVRSSGRVALNATYSDTQRTVEIRELYETVKEECVRTIESISHDFPELIQNEAFHQLRQKITRHLEIAGNRINSPSD